MLAVVHEAEPAWAWVTVSAPPRAPMPATTQAAAQAHSSVVIGPACHTATVEQHPCFCNKRGDVPGLAGGAIPPASPPRFPSPVADRSGGAEREFEQDMKPTMPTTMRSHSIVKEGPEDGDFVGSRAKNFCTAIGGILMPPGACRGSRRLEAEGRARLLRSRPPDINEGSPGGRADSAQFPTGTETPVMGLLARRRSLAGVRMALPFGNLGERAGLSAIADVCARQRLQRATLRP